MNTNVYSENKTGKKPKIILAWRAPREVIADFEERKRLLGMKEDAELLAEIYKEGLAPAFERLLDDAKWGKYRPVIINCGGKTRTLEDDGFDQRFQSGVVLEQMTFIIPMTVIREWSNQSELGVSVAGEEVTLTKHTLNKWRTLLAYFDLNESQQPKSK